MDPIIKQRLVGSLILLALGTVFWPIVFVEPEQPVAIEVGPMPAPPVIDQTPLPEPQSPKALVLATVPEPEVIDEAELLEVDVATGERDGESALSTDDLPEKDKLETLATREQKPAVTLRDSAGFANAWALQVVATGSETRAEQLVSELVAKGYEAYHRRFDQSDKSVWRVQIGPTIERDKLLALKPEIDASLKVNARVVKYRP